MCARLLSTKDSWEIGFIATFRKGRSVWVGAEDVSGSLLINGRLETVCPGDDPRRRETQGGTTEALDSW